MKQNWKWSRVRDILPTEQLIAFRILYSCLYNNPKCINKNNAYVSSCWTMDENEHLCVGHSVTVMSLIDV